MVIQSSPDRELRELALFAGAGGGILGGHLLGWRTVVAVERDAYAAQVLAQRQNDRTLAPFPIWSDVRSFDARAWRGIVDVVSGGFPCQDISLAGTGDGLEGERSGLWREFVRIVRDADPEFVYVENSPALTTRGLGTVLGDLASMGFDAEWGVLSAADLGAPHLRERIWIAAHSLRHRHKRPIQSIAEHGRSSSPVAGRDGPLRAMADADGEGLPQREIQSGHARQEHATAVRTSRWPAEPGMDRVANGMAYRVDRIRALGNGQVSRVAAAAWRILRSPDQP